jgi:hypothetical protein
MERARKDPCGQRLAISGDVPHPQVLETHVVPSLGHIRLSALDRDILRELAEAGEKRLRAQPKPEKRRGRGTGTRSFQAAYAALSACLSEAVDNGLITVNPCLKQGRRPVKPHHQKAPIEVLAWEQIEKLLATAQGDDYEPYL